MNILYFSAPWCGPCAEFAPRLMEVATEFGVTIEKVNIDENLMLGQRYRVTNIPTLAKDGDPRHPRLVGSASNDDLRNWLSNLSV